MKNQTKNIVIALAVIIGSGTLIYFMSGTPNLSFLSGQNFDSQFKKVASVNEATKQIEETFNSTPKKIYESTIARLKFEYPENYSVGEFDEAKGRTILIQDADENTGMQILVSDFDEPNLQLTPERIKQDIPDLNIENPQELKIDGKVTGILFASNNAISQESVELWFVYRDKLYQISSFREHATLVQKVIETLKLI
jgi:hypothetical protein